jgi:hypothetical protein
MDVLHLWEHYLFTQDKNYLRNIAFPIMKESAEFVRGFLVKGPGGYLATAPSYSPENAFIHPYHRQAYPNHLFIHNGYRDRAGVV